MASKEQHLEFEHLSDLPLIETIRRRKANWDDEETDIYPSHLDVRQARVPSSPTPKPQLEWSEFRKLVEDWNEPIQRPILQMFIANNGPMAVARGVKNELAFIRNSSEIPGEISSHILGDAYGVTFERLACYWLKIITGGDRKVLDVGSAQRVARAFERTSGIHIFPDGFIINDNYNPPLLEAACEYKTNPTDPNSRDSLNRQVKGLVGFFTRFGNKTLQARENDRFYLDRRARWVVREIQIAARPSIILVIPQNRDYKSSSEFVEVRKAPFSVGQLSRIVLTLLDDIHETGFIKQELALFEERRLKELL